MRLRKREQPSTSSADDSNAPKQVRMDEAVVKGEQEAANKNEKEEDGVKIVEMVDGAKPGRPFRTADDVKEERRTPPIVTVADENPEPRSSAENEEDKQKEKEEKLALDQLEKLQKELDQAIQTSIQQIVEPYYKRRANFTKQIPGFWLRMLKNHPDTTKLLENKLDEEFLSTYLIDIKVKEMENGCKLKFYFAENPYFLNREIAKEYNWEKKPFNTVTEIKWKIDEEKELLKFGQYMRKQPQPFAIKGGSRPPMFKLMHKTFFNWLAFEDELDKSEGRLYYWGDRKTKNKNMKHIMEAIRDDIWKHPLNWFKHNGKEQQKEQQNDSDDEEYINWLDLNYDVDGE